MTYMWPCYSLPFHKEIHNCSSQIIVCACWCWQYLGHFTEKTACVRGLTLADSVPSLHCGLPADFLNCCCSIDNVLTCFSLFVNVLHYRLHFLPYCIGKEKRLGLLLHILSFYTFILEWWDYETARTTGLLLRDFKMCIFNTTVE